jgi:hypothetical protein
MKCLLFLISLGVIYYFYQSRYPQPIINHIYISTFIILSLSLMYLMNFQKKFMYEVAKNVNQANKVPIYTIVPDFKINKENNNITY